MCILVFFTFLHMFFSYNRQSITKLLPGVSVPDPGSVLMISSLESIRKLLPGVPGLDPGRFLLFKFSH